MRQRYACVALQDSIWGLGNTISYNVAASGGRPLPCSARIALALDLGQPM